jgi:hypothetical protein
VFGSVIPYPSGGGKNYDRRIGGEQVEKAERAEVHVSLPVNSGSKADGPGRHDMLQVILFFYGCQLFQIEDHKRKSKLLMKSVDRFTSEQVEKKKRNRLDRLQEQND